LCNQIRTVDEVRFGRVHGQFGPETMQRIDNALKVSLGLA
jgi:mRNA-degrading endonuclease toxin of MazEF toxin-antitoxin module